MVFQMADGERYLANVVYWRGQWRTALGILDASEDLCGALREQWPHLDDIPPLVLEALERLEEELG
jgi:hypothetical protein